jgi:hypothetical protein
MFQDKESKLKKILKHREENRLILNGHKEDEPGLDELAEKNMLKRWGSFEKLKRDYLRETILTDSFYYCKALSFDNLCAAL